VSSTGIEKQKVERRPLWQVFILSTGAYEPVIFLHGTPTVRGAGPRPAAASQAALPCFHPMARETIAANTDDLQPNAF